MIKESKEKTVLYEDVRRVEWEGKKGELNLEVVNNDCIDVMYGMVGEGYKPMMLNMASEIHPGGGWKKGSIAQEECLFYNSTYHRCLTDEFYPLRLYNAVYSPFVYFFKYNGEVLHYEDWPAVACLAIPALRNPDSYRGKYSKDSDRKIMKEKIDSMFKIALKNGHDSLILSAFGCGAFHNPVEEVASMFKDAVKRFGPYFKKIVFAIIDNERTQNYSVFKKALL